MEYNSRGVREKHFSNFMVGIGMSKAKIKNLDYLGILGLREQFVL